MVLIRQFAAIICRKPLHSINKRGPFRPEIQRCITHGHVYYMKCWPGGQLGVDALRMCARLAKVGSVGLNRRSLTNHLDARIFYSFLNVYNQRRELPCRLWKRAGEEGPTLILRYKCLLLSNHQYERRVGGSEQSSMTMWPGST